MYGDLDSFAWEAPAEPGVFSWQECELWRDAPGMRQPVLALVGRPGAPTREYYPLAGNQSLYRVLAAVDPTEEGILAFVQRYGRLGEGVEAWADLPDGRSALVEPLREWRTVITWLGEQVRVWDMIEAGDLDGLAPIIQWDGKKAVRYQMPVAVRRSLLPEWDQLPEEFRRDADKRDEDFYTIAGGRQEGDRLLRLTPGDVLQPARYWLLDGVNGMLGNTTQPALLWDDTGGRVILRHYPRSLLGAAYLQFAVAILSGRVSRICQVCGRSFEVTKIASRNDRLTCSNTCRTRAYRDRQKKAQELHAAGKAPQEIAVIIGSDLETVAGWLHKEGDSEPARG
jgi:hypothetical protein